MAAAAARRCRSSATNTARLALAVALTTIAAALGAVDVPHPTARADDPDPEGLEVAPLGAGDALRVHVPGAEGGKTVIGQLTVAQVSERGYVTAYACDDGVPTDSDGNVNRSDLNYDGQAAPIWSNRLIVEADDDGDVCFYTERAVEMIVDVNALTFDTGITSFANRRTDTRLGRGPVEPGGVLLVRVPEAVGRRTVIGQLTAARVSEQGYVTAFGCDDGLPRDAADAIDRSDLNYDGRVTPARSNRLIVQADADGDICFYTQRRADLVVDVNGVADEGIASFANRRTDTRADGGRPTAGGVLRVNVPEAVGAKTVVGQLTAARVTEAGYVTAFGCDDGVPVDQAGTVDRSDLNYDPRISAQRSNRLIVQADADGDVCFHTLRSIDLVIDVNAVSGAGITSFPNLRTDTRSGVSPGSRLAAVDSNGVRVWPIYEALGPLHGVAALTGLPADPTVTSRPIIAAKIDNYRLARPHAALDLADAVIEVNVEGVSRFIALFHTHVPGEVGPVRSARTTDLDLLAAMNRPIFAYSGANPGVTGWIRSADDSDVLVDRGDPVSGCYRRDPERPRPHNLLAQPGCLLATGAAAGAARPLWLVDAGWAVPSGVSSWADTTFDVSIDGVRVQWTWDATAGRYLRSQDDAPHLTATDARIAVSTVVELAVVHTPSVVDARSPHVVTTGSGNARVHRDGRAIPATWTREEPYDPFTFRDATTGAPLPLDQGVVFLEFVRDG